MLFEFPGEPGARNEKAFRWRGDSGCIEHRYCGVKPFELVEPGAILARFHLAYDRNLAYATMVSGRRQEVQLERLISGADTTWAALVHRSARRSRISVQQKPLADKVL